LEGEFQKPEARTERVLDNSAGLCILERYTRKVKWTVISCNGEKSFEARSPGIINMILHDLKLDG
jgi:hypothetical protein